MANPYSVLGVDSNASDDEVKRAYRDLVRKYHPDNYHDNPLSDLAQDKMKEINEAYDEIMRMRGQGGSSGASQSPGGYRQGSYGGGSAQYSAIRNAINSGNLDFAEQQLNSISTHDAEWYFLMGSVYYRRGWIDQARQYYQTANQMAPGNQEYRQAMAHVNSGGSPYRYSQDGGMSTGDCCSSLICADCLCECFGGNLIPCLGCR